MDTTEFERLLQNYLRKVNTLDIGIREDAEQIDAAAYEALTEAAGLLGVSMRSEQKA